MRVSWPVLFRAQSRGREVSSSPPSSTACGLPTSRKASLVWSATNTVSEAGCAIFGPRECPNRDCTRQPKEGLRCTGSLSFLAPARFQTWSMVRCPRAAAQRHASRRAPSALRGASISTTSCSGPACASCARHLGLEHIVADTPFCFFPDPQTDALSILRASDPDPNLDRLRPHLRQRNPSPHEAQNPDHRPERLARPRVFLRGPGPRRRWLTYFCERFGFDFRPRAERSHRPVSQQRPRDRPRHWPRSVHRSDRCLSPAAGARRQGRARGVLHRPRHSSGPARPHRGPAGREGFRSHECGPLRRPSRRRKTRRFHRRDRARDRCRRHRD